MHNLFLFSVGIAAAVPELDLFISLFGALCLSALGLAFPAIIQTCTYWHYVSRSERIRMVIKNAIVVLFGVLGLIVGTWTSLDGIITKFSNPDHHLPHNYTLSDAFNGTIDAISPGNITFGVFDNDTSV